VFGLFPRQVFDCLSGSKEKGCAGHDPKVERSLGTGQTPQGTSAWPPCLAVKQKLLVWMSYPAATPGKTAPFPLPDQF